MCACVHADKYMGLYVGGAEADVGYISLLLSRRFIYCYCVCA